MRTCFKVILLLIVIFCLVPCLLAGAAIAQTKPVVVFLATGGTIAMKIDPVKHAPVPAISGEEVSRRLRVMHPGAKTLLLTGCADFLEIDQTGVDARMSKPFAPEALRATVKQLIGGPAALD